VKTDNAGAMFMAQNASSGVRTRHIDTCYHYIRENLEEEIINIKFVKSIENDSNVFSQRIICRGVQALNVLVWEGVGDISLTFLLF
jgi:hypothetical protein